MNENAPSSLNPAQQEAVDHSSGPLLIVAGAGSGKTRVVTHRVASLLQRGIPSWRVLAITFTNRAAREMAERVERLVPNSSVWVSTFHSFAARMLRIDGEKIDIPRNFNIADRDDQEALVKRTLKREGVSTREVRPSAVLSVISRWKNEGVAPEDLHEERLAGFEELALKAYVKYEKDLAIGHLLDFDDLLLRCRDLLKHPVHGLAWRQRFQEVLVDEFQDTNSVQGEMVAALASEGANLTVCGDPDQSIYSWRGADVTNILRFEAQFPGTTIVRLERNYRSTGAILDAASTLIEHNQARIERRLYSEKGSGEPLELMGADSEGREADWVAQRVLALRRELDIQYSDIALLYRTNALSRSFERTFRAYAIPYHVVGTVEFFARKEIKDLLAFLRLRANPHDTEAFARVVNLPSRGIGERSQLRLLAEAAAARTAVTELIRDPERRPKLKGKAQRGLAEFAGFLDLWCTQPDDEVGPLLDRLLEETDYLAYLERIEGPSFDDRRANVEGLVSDAHEYDRAVGRGLRAYLESRVLVQDADDQSSEDDDQVSMMTLHSAKGLEFRAVFLVCMEDGVLPHRRSEEDRDSEEERRLMYVGMTRAQERLALSYSRERFRFGRFEPAAPSPFLEEIRDHLPEPHLVQRAGVDQEYGHQPWQDSVDAGIDFESDHDHHHAQEGETMILDDGIDEGFDEGETVSHEVFGVGEILQVRGAGNSARIRVRFRTGIKVIQLGYTRLRKVRPR